MSQGFDADRMEWARSMEAKAQRFYREMWPAATFHSLEAANWEADGDLSRLLDFTGMDLLVETDAGLIQVAQRFRRADNARKDLTLRYRSSGVKTEWDRLMAAHGDPYVAYPRVMSFGVARAVEQEEKRVYEGDHWEFEHFYLIDTEAMLRALQEGSITYQGPIPNTDHSSFIAISPVALRRVGAIIREWDETEPETAHDYHSDASTWGL